MIVHRQTQNGARERIQQVAENWFLTEPALFAVYCSHHLAMNAAMLCALRTGKGRIEYNPTVIDVLKDNQLTELLKVEMIRILLQHPYARQPLGCKPLVQHAASDMVISTAYKLAWNDLLTPEEFGLPQGQHYEWYATRLNEMIHLDEGMPSEKGSDEEQEGKQDSGKNVSDRDMNAEADYTALWEEDQFQARMITDMVQSTMGWGSIPSDMVELIKKAAEGKIDFRSALQGFRATILSQKRRLTRMRPSRRFGFEQMGSHYDFTTRLLVAVDTSGSVSSEVLGRYFRIITTFFKYGIQEIDVLMFDTNVQGKPFALKEARKNIAEFKVQGRGGTSFQVPVDYVKQHPDYDGLIIITDGCAPTPEVPPHLKTKLLWIIDNEIIYKRHYESLRKTGRVCLMQL